MHQIQRQQLKSDQKAVFRIWIQWSFGSGSRVVNEYGYETLQKRLRISSAEGPVRAVLRSRCSRNYFET